MKQEGQFNPIKFLAEKYPNVRLDFLTKPQYVSGLAQLHNATYLAVTKAMEGFKRRFKSEYDIIGLLLTGSWAYGMPHSRSNINYITISTKNPHDLVRGFRNRLKKSLSRYANEADLCTDYQNMSLDDHTRVMETIGRNRPNYLRHYLLITPYEEYVISVLKGFHTFSLGTEHFSSAHIRHLEQYYETPSHILLPTND
jgi:hypothetical protein